MKETAEIEREFTEAIMSALNWQDNFSATLTNQLTGQSKVIEDCLFLDSPSGLNK